MHLNVSKTRRLKTRMMPTMPHSITSSQIRLVGATSRQCTPKKGKLAMKLASNFWVINRPPIIQIRCKTSTIRRLVSLSIIRFQEVRIPSMTSSCTSSSRISCRLLSYKLKWEFLKSRFKITVLSIWIDHSLFQEVKMYSLALFTSQMRTQTSKGGIPMLWMPLWTLK